MKTSGGSIRSRHICITKRKRQIKMIIRKYMPADCEPTAKLFYDTVHTVNAADYTAEQLNAWANGRPDLSQWNDSLCRSYAVTAKENGMIIGFGNIDGGYLDKLFVHKDYQRRGIASAICDKLEKAEKSDKIITHASITAKPFFERRGYTAMKEQQVQRAGIYLTNYVMEKRLNLKSNKA